MSSVSGNAQTVSLQQLFARAFTLHQQGSFAEAGQLYRQVLQHAPDDFDTLQLLGIIEIQHNRPLEALALLERALQVNPGSIAAHTNYSALLVSLQRYDDAVRSCERALALDSAVPELLNNYSAALINLRRYDEALASCARAIALKPDFVDALNNMGNALNRLKRYADALPYYDRALSLNPNYVEAWFNRGNAFKHLRQYEQALASFDRALALKPRYPDAWLDRGNTLNRLKRYQEAAQAFANALAVNPSSDYALGNQIHAQLHACDWRGYHVNCQRLLAAVRQGRHVDNPFSFLTTPSSAADQLRCARLYVEDRFPPAATPLWSGEIYRHERIRLAYLSSDFHNHATAFLMAELFERHDRSRFDVRVFSFGAEKRGDMRERIAQACDVFVDVSGLSDRQIAAMLREQEIDIAVDLKGYTQDSRTDIFSQRPAPVQINYLGYPGTMGAPYIDYLIADHYVIPDGSAHHYHEAVVRLPGCYQVNDSKRRIAEHCPSRQQLHLPPSGFVFCCFNNNYKITPDIFAVWMRLLAQVKGSVLWLLADNPAAVDNLRLQAQAHGIEPQRLVFAERMGLAEHLARHRHADLFLDTVPVNAHTGASDALWAGLPVLTLSTDAFVGRVAGSLLTTLALPGLIATSLADYEAKALQLALTPDLLARLQLALSGKKTSSLFDCRSYSRHLESAYLTMYRRYQHGLRPEAFDVQAHE